MKIDRVDEAFEKCKTHLTSTNSFNTEIESYLTQYLIILICSAVEEEIEKIVTRRAGIVGDPYIESFSRSCVGKLFRNVRTSDISGLLGRFGADYQQAFQNKITGTKAETFFNNIVSNRHKVAHESGVNTTFKELVMFYTEGGVVLDAFNEVIFANAHKSP